ncbi:YwmB family TATA-box binding protein [Pullulanibacillus sp. KACC 23026]|uniref:YwmB family TATA-box binding protein n=1 Tax=Pullulanibacillus sp. KACC 23026 TaxID=3028315 RepID=UPI0023AF0D40|nr:YwmB family TATA-box binding protein [Pullulanibacillus sp. KACC 23026]WEG13117.1 YwmB family TATA-box binding protein [Pullulanibacillus sp. KACC 23026]
MGKQTKTLILCFLCFMFIGALTPTLAKGKTQDTSKLPELIHVLKVNGAHVKNWSIYARQQNTDLQTYQEVQSEARTLKEAFNNYNWQVKKEKMDVRFLGTKKDKASALTESITLLAYPQKNAYQTYLIYEINGTGWNASYWTNHLSIEINQQVTKIFDEKTQIFACVTGDFGDKMNIVLSKKSNAILKTLKAHKIESDHEKTFSSVSAYTELWKEQTIQSNGRSINLQLGLRKVDDKTTVTLGTPIITSEY